MTSFYVARHLRWVAPASLIAVLLTGGCASTPEVTDAAPAEPTASHPPVQQAGRPARQPAAAEPPSPAETEFIARVNQYLELHKNLAQGLPDMPKDAKREEIFARQQVLLKRLQAARKAARPGEVFTPAMRDYVRRMMAKLTAGPAGGQLRASIMDENPASVKLSVNMPYPSTVPLATMPPTVLASLPKTPEVLEYRFLGDDLILLDVRAQMIVDFVPQALPK
jgi:hypothetical protein